MVDEATKQLLAEMTGLRKAAILMISLQPEHSAAILRQLDQEMIEDISREIARLDNILPTHSGAIIEEFYTLALASDYVKLGGLGYARNLLDKVLSPDQASRILRMVEHTVHQKPFAFLHKTDAENLTTFIQDEHPQTIALILSYVTPSKASDILAGLPHAKQIEVVTRVARMENTNPEVIREVEEGLEMRLSGLVQQTFQKAGGVETVAEMLNLADRGTEKSIIEALEAQDPDLVEQIRRLMFIFEDLLLVNDKGIQQVLKEVDNEELSLALKTASQELSDKIFRNMSERAATMIQEDMDFMGPVRVSDVETAQQKIVDIVRRLEDSGELIISGRGGEKEMIV